MKTKAFCIIAVAAGLGWVLASAPYADAHEGCGSTPTGTVTAAKPSCGSGCADTTAVAGPTGATGKKCCGTCGRAKAAATKKCCGKCGGATAATAKKCCGKCGGATAAASKKGCGATCTKACCAGKPVAAQAHLNAILKHIDAAYKAVEAGKKKAALASLAKARQLATIQRDAADKKVASLANATCPMTGRPVKAGYTRVHNENVVGFCGPGCASHFDKASAEKQSKITAKITAAKGPTGASGTVKPGCPSKGGSCNR